LPAAATRAMLAVHKLARERTMADAPVVHIGENSPEQVAYKLLRDIAQLEKRSLFHGETGSADRQWLLDTYAECLEATMGNRSKGPTRTPSR